MAAPLTAPWDGTTTPISPDSLNRSTHGSGTTAERTALASWPLDRLFYDTTTGSLYRNGGTVNAPVWTALDKPSGTLEMWGGSKDAIPAGYLICDGAAVNRVTYAALYAAIGTRYGAGDGATTFNVPDIRDRFPRGAGAGDQPGATGGEDTHALTANEMPQHNHAVNDPGHTHDVKRLDTLSSSSGQYMLSGVQAVGAEPSTPGYLDNANTGITLGNAGGNAAHENRPRFLEILFMIKT